MAMPNASKGWIVDLTVVWVFEDNLSPGLERDLSNRILHLWRTLLAGLSFSHYK